MNDILQKPQGNGGDQYTVAPLIPSDRFVHTHTIRPETFRLPGNRQRDPYFGNTRPFYYELNKEVKVLIHLRKKGKQRGVTLVDYDAVLNHIRKSKAAELEN